MNGTRVGYACCSTDEQDVVIQTEQLLTLGVPEDRIYIDRGFSGTARRNRAGLDQALAAVWNGSVFTVTKFDRFDRFARNMAEANEILTDLSGRGVLFGLGGSVYDWNDPFGRLFLQTLAMVAEFEANLGNLRTREGMAPAMKNGKLKGKQPELPEPARCSIRRRYAEGGVSLADLATEYSVGRSTIHRPETSTWNAIISPAPSDQTPALGVTLRSRSFSAPTAVPGFLNPDYPPVRGQRRVMYSAVGRRRSAHRRDHPVPWRPGREAPSGR
ncbi:recombinase family protein [Sphaerisporangium fuscum]|uniref:recombinase family protein n=1 Tax=Sphaerisporangium fuscum TaxID=2835868 RepID=UPI0027E2A06C|nr:recombinase family protein [Sphaerisporangium fuscum]